MTLESYLNLITSAYRDKPIFVATISIGLEIQTHLQQLLDSMVPIFDLDVAVGEQLDVIGKWVGVSRNVRVPIDGVYFTWDGDYTLGWDYGTWQPANQPSSVTVLPDDAYRTLIRANIAANRWDGTTDGAYTIWDAVFPTITILIQDNQNMTYDLAIIGGIIDSLSLALITGGYIPLKPEGVRIAAYYVSVDDGPVFAWDLDAPLLKGWDEGSWVRELAPT
jgi:hypothetical protein